MRIGQLYKHLVDPSSQSPGAGRRALLVLHACQHRAHLIFQRRIDRGLHQSLQGLLIHLRTSGVMTCVVQGALLGDRVVQRLSCVGVLCRRQQDRVDDVNYTVRSIDVGFQQTGIIDGGCTTFDGNPNRRSLEGLRRLRFHRIVRIHSSGDDMVLQDIDQLLLVFGLEQ